MLFFFFQTVGKFIVDVDQLRVEQLWVEQLRVDQLYVGPDAEEEDEEAEEAEMIRMRARLNNYKPRDLLL